MSRKNKKTKIVAFLFSIILMGIGYAFLYSKKHTTNTITVRVGLKNNLTTEQYASVLGKNIKFSYFLEYDKYEPGSSSERINYKYLLLSTFLLTVK